MGEDRGRPSDWDLTPCGEPTHLAELLGPCGRHVWFDAPQPAGMAPINGCPRRMPRFDTPPDMREKKVGRPPAADERARRPAIQAAAWLADIRGCSRSEVVEARFAEVNDTND